MSFNKFRYLEKEGKTPKYSFIENKGIHAVYRVMDYEGIKNSLFIGCISFVEEKLRLDCENYIQTL